MRGADQVAPAVGQPAVRDDRSPLQRLFEPRAIALYGASNDPSSSAYQALSNLKRSGFAGQIVPVNPRQTEVGGYRCYSSASEFGGPIDHAMCVVGAERVLSVLQDCAQAGIPTAGVYAGGFAEIGAAGGRLQRELSRFTQKSGIRVLGPNCYGYANGTKQVTASMGTLLEVISLDRGGLGIVSQSGAIAAALMYECKSKGVDVGFLVSTGNEMDVRIEDCIDYLCDSPSITRIALYLEGVRDVASLRSSLRRARLQGKDVIVLRAGRTRAGKVAVKSHTASLVTDARLYEALFRDLGAITVSSLRELADVARVSELSTSPTESVAIATSSGGTAALAADACEASALPLARISRSRLKALRVVNPHCSATNPIDMTGRTSQDLGNVRPFLAVLLDDPSITRVVFMYGSAMMSPGRGEQVTDTLKSLSTEYGTDRLAFVGAVPEHINLALRAARIPVFDDPVVLFSLLGRVRMARMTKPPPDARPLTRSGARTRTLLESTALRILERSRVPVVPRVLVEDEAGVRAVKSSLGFPLFAKAVLPHVVHKAKIGGIRSNLRSDDALLEAWKELAILARARGDTPRMLVETQIEGIRAEILISGFVDRVLGPFLAIGTGGALTELVDDIVFVPMPATASRIRRALQGLKIWPSISGGRSRVGADVAQVTMVVLQLQRLLGTRAEGGEQGDSFGRILSIEINPFVLAASSSCAVDAVIEVEGK